MSPKGQGSRIVIEPAEAAVVRRIFETFGAGPGLKAIAHELNAEAVLPPRPRSQKGRRPSWASSAIREMFRNELYRSEWRNPRRGPRRRTPRPESEWLRAHREEWRIASEELWEVVGPHREPLACESSAASNRPRPARTRSTCFRGASSAASAAADSTSRACGIG